MIRLKIKKTEFFLSADVAGDHKGDLGFFASFARMQPVAAPPPGSTAEASPEILQSSTQVDLVGQKEGFQGQKGSERNDAVSLVAISKVNNSEKSDESSQYVSTMNPAISRQPTKKSWVQVAQKHVFSKQKFVVS